MLPFQKLKFRFLKGKIKTRAGCKRSFTKTDSQVCRISIYVSKVRNVTRLDSLIPGTDYLNQVVTNQTEMGK